MTAAEVRAIESANRRAAIGATAKGAAKGGVIAAAAEVPVAVLENIFHLKRGRKSPWASNGRIPQRVPRVPVLLGLASLLRLREL